MIFDRIVCGVGSAASLAALHQALRLRAPQGRLVAVTVSELALAVHAGWDAAKVAAQLREEAAEAYRAVRREIAGVPSAEARLVEGRPLPFLLAIAEREQATLMAVGTHGHRRAAGLAFGCVATMVLHDAPCSVLLARAPTDAEGFPRAVVVGVDGSAQSAQAVAVAFELGKRLGASVRPVVAAGGKGFDLGSVRRLVGEVEIDPRHPVEALAACSRGADLLVVGSRGLHGLRALGSVSERVAHRAACSVLVVRGLEDGERA